MKDYTVDKLIKDHMIKVLTITDGNRTHAAKMLGLNLRTFRNWMYRYQLEKMFKSKYGVESHLKK